MEEFVINSKFQNALPSLTEEEFKQLEDNIVSDGYVRDALVLWGNTIVDGHNRWKIIQRHPEVTYTTVHEDFKDEWDAIRWICEKQLGQRNLDLEQKHYTIGKLYEAQKNTRGGKRDMERDEHGRFAANLHFVGLPSRSNAVEDKVAEEQNVSVGTVRRAYDFARAVDKGEEDIPGFRDAVVSGKTNASMSDIRNLNKMDDEERKEAVEAILSGEKVQKKEPVYVQPTEIIQIGDAPYDEQDFEEQISYFPKDFDDNIRLFLLVHGDMLSLPKCKAAFMLMLKDAGEVIKKYKEVAKNEY